MSWLSTDVNAFAEGPDVAVVDASIAARKEELILAENAVKEADAKLDAAKAAVDAFSPTLSAARAKRYEASKETQTASNAVDKARTLVATAQAKVTVARAPFHPVRRTPLEILGLIFEHCTYVEDPFEPVYFNRYSRRTPFRLATVCRRWRDASLKSPRAWSRIELNLDYVTGALASRAKKYLELHIARSGKAPLYLYVERDRKPRAFDRPLIDMMAKKIFPRCNCLALKMSMSESGDTSLPLLQTATPILRELHIEIFFPEDWKPSKIFPRTPLLQRCVAVGHYEAFHSPEVDSFADLTTICNLELHDMAEPQIKAYLEGAPNTSRLTLVHPTFNSKFPMTGTAKFPSVTRLEMRWPSDEARFSQFSRYFIFSNLKELCLVARSKDSRFIDYLTMSSKPALSTLQVLELKLKRLHSGAFPQFLDVITEKCDALRCLFIDLAEFNDEDLVSLNTRLGKAHSQSKGWALRCLEELRLGWNCEFHKDCDQTLLAQMVESRMGAVGSSTIAALRVVELPTRTDSSVTQRVLDSVSRNRP